MKKYILALDEGTTSARAILFDKNCNIVSMASQSITQIYPNPGWVEHDPLEIYSSQYSALITAITKIDAKLEDIASIGITNQRETTIIWDKYTGEPIYNAIVWQCRRTHEICNDLEKYKEYIKENTGLTVDAYFSATKIKWILDNVDGARDKANNGELLFGTVDTFLLWKLSDGKIHVTDYTNASRTMIYNIKKLCWDDFLLDILNIPKCMLPEVKSSSEIYGSVNIMGQKIEVSGIAGDQQAALFGQGCINTGDIKNTYGTGCFLLMNTGNVPYVSKSGLLTTMAATKKGQNQQYALEGSVFSSGAVIQWLRDELGIINDASQTENMAKSVDSSEGVYIIPAFSGLGAPYWDMYARGMICGLTRGSNKNHIVRAALEAICFQTNDLILAIKNDTNININSIRVDGGATQNNFLLQTQADISNLKVEKPICNEATALGAAILSGIAVGFWKDEQEASNKIEKTFIPRIDEEKRFNMIKGWNCAVNCTRQFVFGE